MKTDHDNTSDPRQDRHHGFDRDAPDADDTRDEDDAPDEDNSLDAAGGDADDATSADERSRASQLWLVAACLCLLAAAPLWLLGHADAAFVVAALGVISWFLNVRVKLRQK